MKKLVFLTLALVVATATLASAGVFLVGGSYTGGNTIPFWASQAGMRWQTIWDKSKILESGKVTKVEFITHPSVPIAAPSTFNTCKVLLCNTTLGHVTTSYVGNYSGQTPVTVFSGTKVIPATPVSTWVTIFSSTKTGFNYDRKYNLLIEVSWVSATGNRCDFQTNSRGSHGRIYAYSATATTGSVTTNYDQLGRVTITPNVGVAPTSLGRVKSIFK